jgi:hypothetical protein
MSKRAAFWDASALVPLCIHQAGSRQAQSQLRKFMPVVWWGVWLKFTVRLHDSVASANLRMLRNKELCLVSIC